MTEQDKHFIPEGSLENLDSVSAFFPVINCVETDVRGYMGTTLSQAMYYAWLDARCDRIAPDYITDITGGWACASGLYHLLLLNHALTLPG